MFEINMGMVLTSVISAVVIAAVLAFVGMSLWYNKTKPEIESIKKEIADKAAAAEVIRVASDLEQKKADKEHLEDTLSNKQNIIECELQRKACQPLLLEQLRSLSSKVDDLREGQKVQQTKLDRLMIKNGIIA